ncbi:MAG: universal stress protein [Acidobacteria bacterium]|nr:universal stress protein [Acidobacteriota bacterium]
MTKDRIVVGVEGSGGAIAALRWAITEAGYRDATIEVVTAYLPTYVPAAPDFGFVSLDPIDLNREVEKLQARVIDSAIGDLGEPKVEIRRSLRKGRPADMLIEASADADLLVVGDRGRGGFRGLLLGSVSTQVSHHAKCPVVIVRRDLLDDELTDGDTPVDGNDGD